MKSVIRLFILVLAVFLFTNAKPQDSDPNVGLYVDWIKVNELTCYSFKKLTLVLPYNPEFDRYDKFQVAFTIGTESDLYVYGKISKPALKANNVKGKYFVYDVFVESSELVNFQRDPGTEVWEKRGALAYYNGKLIDEASFSLEGLSVKGIKEYYDDGCQCVKKEPEYAYEKLAETKIPLKNRTKKGIYSEPARMKVDMSSPCTPTGTQVDFNNLK